MVITRTVSGSAATGGSSWIGRSTPARISRAHLSGQRGLVAARADVYRPALRCARARASTAAGVDLGGQELLDEVLGVSVHDCAARWVASVYVTSPPADRADNVLEALNAVDAVAPMAEPLAAMERVVLDPLPGLADFLPRWSALLQREAASGPRWHERSRLREAVMRAEGTAGLARLARTSKCPEDARAWCTAVAAEGNWAAVLRVNDEAVALVESPHDRGDFHDAAALAARELGRPDFAARLETA